MASVQISDLRKSFGATEILRGISVDIADGDFVTLVGPSGCGKSTLLRMIAGLEDVTSGDIRIGDEVVNDVPPKERNIAMVFQNYALYPNLDVAQNMGFALRQQGVAKEERNQRVREVAKLLDLEPYLDRKPRNLSGGQRQRVAMGRAIVRHPQVFLMDEPLSNLDAKLRVQTRTELVELQHRLAVTTVYVTHDQVEAMTMGDRVAVLRDGYLQQCDTPATLYHAPGNLFVAGFIGSPAMNTLPVAPTGPVEIAGAPIGVDDDLGGDRTIVGFRPEAVGVGSGSIQARIRVVEDLGSEVFVHVLIDHLGEERRLVARAEPPFRGRAGDNVQIGVHGAVHLFDAAEVRRTTVTV
jgi:multiple sugar transport system ATP-binding protein